MPLLLGQTATMCLLQSLERAFTFAVKQKVYRSFRIVFRSKRELLISITATVSARRASLLLFTY